MKTLKSLLMLCAGLSFCACGSDNEPQLPEGAGMIEVKIANPSTRANNGDNINISGTITITLTHNNGQKLTQTVEVEEGQLAERSKTVKFWNVVSPEKVTASINGGLATYVSVPINSTEDNAETTEVKEPNMQAEPKSIPAYGETTTFTLTGTMTATENEAQGSGYTQDDKGKLFQKYSAEIQMAIPVARLTVGTISHEAHGGQDDVCLFTGLKIQGVYLDNTSLYGTAYANNVYPSVQGSGTDYAGFETAVLKKGVDSPTDATFAASAFNFYATTGNPTFKVYFSSAKFAAGDGQQEREAWAMIKSYKDINQQPITMQNGKIYEIANVTLLDENILGDEENDAVYGVEVTVKEAVWTVVTTNVEWEQ